MKSKYYNIALSTILLFAFIFVQIGGNFLHNHSAHELHIEGCEVHSNDTSNPYDPITVIEDSAVECSICSLDLFYELYNHELAVIIPINKKWVKISSMYLLVEYFSRTLFLFGRAPPAFF